MYIFPPFNCNGIFARNRLLYIVDVSGLSILFYWSIFLSLHCINYCYLTSDRNCFLFLFYIHNFLIYSKSFVFSYKLYINGQGKNEQCFLKIELNQKHFKILFLKHKVLSPKEIMNKEVVNISLILSKHYCIKQQYIKTKYK